MLSNENFAFATPRLISIKTGQFSSESCFSVDKRINVPSRQSKIEQLLDVAIIRCNVETFLFEPVKRR